MEECSPRVSIQFRQKPEELDSIQDTYKWQLKLLEHKSFGLHFQTLLIIHLMQHNSLQMEEWGHFVVKG